MTEARPDDAMAMAGRLTQRRSEVTRHRVIDAAIRTFGREGFERTTTRALVERAGTNLVAIHYHFGSKKAVYRAAARHIAAAIRERNREIIERGRRVAEKPDPSAAELVECVCGLFDDYAALALSGSMPECWRRFLMREQARALGHRRVRAHLHGGAPVLRHRVRADRAAHRPAADAPGSPAARADDLRPGVRVQNQPRGRPAPARMALARPARARRGPPDSAEVHPPAADRPRRRPSHPAGAWPSVRHAASSSCCPLQATFPPVDGVRDRIL